MNRTKSHPQAGFPRGLALLAGVALLVAAGLAPAGEYYHGYYEPGQWGDVSAWVPINGSPLAVPGENDTAYLYYGISLENLAGGDYTIGTLNIDTYISWGPAPDVALMGQTLNIMDGGQWMWGGFMDYYNRVGVVNQYGVLHLVDDIADHYNNGPDVVDAINHPIQWGMTFNNYGLMRQVSQGSFHLGADACQYHNYGVHLFATDGDISTQGHGGERTTNHGTMHKAGGAGETRIDGEFINDGVVRAEVGTIFIGNSLQYEGWWTHELQGGTWVADDGASIVIGGRGELYTNQGHIVLNGSGANFYTTQTYTYTPIDASLMTNEGTLEIYGDRTFANPISNTGTLIVGDDTTLTASLTNGGTVNVGNSPGLSVVAGDFVQTAAGQLNMELAGLIPGDEYDVLVVSGTATLGGTLALSYDDFAATPGDTFVVLDAAALSGSFDDVIYPDAGDWFIDYDLANGDVIVGLVPEPATLGLLLLGGLFVRRRR